MQQSPYWANNSVVEAHFGVDEAEAVAIIAEATAAACQNDKDLQKRRTKRNDAVLKIPEARRGELPQFGDAGVETAATPHGPQHKVLGKDLVKAIRAAAQGRNLPGVAGFGKRVPPAMQNSLADELRIILQAKI